jgi:hypothetical protein
MLGIMPKLVNEAVGETTVKLLTSSLLEVLRLLRFFTVLPLEFPFCVLQKKEELSEEAT